MVLGIWSRRMPAMVLLDISRQPFAQYFLVWAARGGQEKDRNYLERESVGP